MPTLSIVIPTFNEQDNIKQVYAAVSTQLKDQDWEIIFVDDASKDATTDEIVALSHDDHRVRLIRPHRSPWLILCLHRRHAGVDFDLRSSNGCRHAA